MVNSWFPIGNGSSSEIVMRPKLNGNVYLRMIQEGNMIWNSLTFESFEVQLGEGPLFSCRRSVVSLYLWYLKKKERKENGVWHVYL